MKGAPSPLRGAVLGLLKERSGYGYDLAQRMEDRLGPSWNLRRQGLYPILDWAFKEGLITKDEAEATLRSGPRVRYRINERGLAAFDAWMARKPEPEELRSGLIARIAVAGPEDVPTLLAHLDDAERACLAQGAATERPAPKTWDDLCADLIAEKADLRLDSDVAWIEYARNRLRQFSKRAFG